MNRKTMNFCAVLAGLLIGWGSLNAQEAEEPKADPKAAKKSDKTGTNPINFTHDARVYNNFNWLNTSGDGDFNVTTFEFRTPFAEGKWQFRLRARAASIEVDFDGDGIEDIDEFGSGDLDFRFLTVPKMNMAKKRALAVGFETTIDTASDDALGQGALSFGPPGFWCFLRSLWNQRDFDRPRLSAQIQRSRR